MKNIIRLATIFIFVVHTTGFSQKKTNSTKNDKVAVIPIINYNNITGTIFGVVGQMFYDVNPKDTVSSSSSTGVLGLYTTNNSYLIGVFQQLYFNEDKWKLLGAAGFGTINFQFWYDGISAGRFVNYSTKSNFIFLRIEREIINQLYFGLEGTLNKTELGFDLPDWIPENLSNTTSNLNNIGYIIDYDKRDHQINPYSGYNITFRNNFYGTWMNDDNDFHVFDISGNYYFKINTERNILATRFKAVIANGDVPFQGESVIGGDDIRGYSNGRYRNNQVYAIQAEYRWRFYKKFGMVGFAGIASSVDEFGELFSTELLPGAGVGVRYMMIEKERVNIGFDIAKGKDDWSLTFRIGESFGR